MSTLGSGLILAVYVAAIVLAIGLIRDTRWRAVLYSMPLPMSVVLLVGGASDPLQLLGVIMLGAFFWVVVLAESRGVSRPVAVALATSAYVLVGMGMARVDGLDITVAAGLALAAWAVGAWLLRTGAREPGSTVSLITVRRVGLVMLTAAGAVLIGEALGPLLVTFPFLGVALAVSYEGSIRPFARNFWLRGIPALLAFVLAVLIAHERGLATPASLLVGLCAWAVVMVAMYGADAMIRRSRGRRAAIRIARLLLRDPGNRGIGGLIDERRLGDQLLAAARALSTAEYVVIVTGFPIPSLTPPTPETDGPVGSAALATLLALDGRLVDVVTDPTCADIVAATVRAAPRHGGTAPGAWSSHTHEVVGRQRPDVLVFIERPGAAADGRYYSMRGMEIPDVVPLDRLAQTWPGVTVVGVGDGGNEAGMGPLRHRVVDAIPKGELIGSVVPCDSIVVAGTSNWGAYGLMAMVTVLGRLDRPQGYPGVPSFVALDRALLAACVAAGAVDGVRGVPQPTVDGLDQQTYESVLIELEGICAEFE